MVRTALVLPVIAVLMFVPAGSLAFWQGWAFLGIFVVFNAIFVGYFLRRDPDLLERRMRNREQHAEQKQFKLFWVPLWVCTILVPGLDYRLGWSASFPGSVPVWLSVAAWVLVAVSWAMIFQVFRFNSFASATIQVEAGQKVISDGPYRLVRHPMYSGIVLMTLATPVALGSYWAVIPAILLIPVLVFRLVHEERLLLQELPGYAEYCERTRFRLIPSVF